VDPDQPSVVDVSFTTRHTAITSVRFGDDDRSSPPDGRGTRHDHQLLGNPYGRTLALRPVATLDDGTVVEGDRVEVELPPAPAEVPAFDLVVSEPGSQVARGYVAMVLQVGDRPTDPQYVGILNGAGEWVWLRAVTPGRGSSSVAPSLDGAALVWPEYDELRVDPDGAIMVRELDGDLVSTTVAPTLHHAVVQLPDARFAYLGHEFLPIDEPDVGADWSMTDTVEVVPEGDDGTHATRLFAWRRTGSARTWPRTGCRRARTRTARCSATSGPAS
jgi:hypothetical protein